MNIIAIVIISLIIGINVGGGFVGLYFLYLKKKMSNTKVLLEATKEEYKSKLDDNNLKLYNEYQLKMENIQHGRI